MFGLFPATAISCLYLSRVIQTARLEAFAYPRVTHSYSRRAEPGNINELGLSLASLIGYESRMIMSNASVFWVFGFIKTKN